MRWRSRLVAEHLLCTCKALDVTPSIDRKQTSKQTDKRMEQLQKPHSCNKSPRRAYPLSLFSWENPHNYFFLMEKKIFLLLNQLFGDLILHNCTVFLTAVPKYWAKIPKERRVYFGSYTEGAEHHGKEVMAAGMWGSWSHCVLNRKQRVLNAHISLFVTMKWYHS